MGHYQVGHIKDTIFAGAMRITVYHGKHAQKRVFGTHENPRCQGTMASS